MVLGFEGAGTVAAMGPGVSDFRVGDEVYGTAGRFDAEYVTAKVEHIARIPKGLTMAQAGILATSGLSALQGIDDVLRLKAGETLIVHGAAGGVGTLAIQFAKLRGARVLATATTAEGLSLIRRLGADAVVDGRSGDIADAARALCPTRRGCRTRPRRW
ncbi:MAG: zinc-binding dehydrogenase [Steroidobacteraceae bacterium]